MNANLIELPEAAIDCLMNAGDELRAVYELLEDDPASAIDPNEDADWYFRIIADHAEGILRRIEAIEDQLMHRDDG